MLLGRHPNIGLIIDLTKSSRYYDASSAPDTVRVQKLECAGYGTISSESHALHNIPTR